MVDEASDEGLSDYIHKLLDARNLGRLAKGTVVIRQRIREALDKLKADADEWERHFKVANEGLSDKRQELTEAHTVIGMMHPDGLIAFSKHPHLQVCQDVEKLWQEVEKKINIVHTTESHFEVSVKESEREAKESTQAQTAGGE